MEPLARTCRAIWWSFAAAGAVALGAAVVAALDLVPATRVTGAWELFAGAIVAVAIIRGPGARQSIPFLGAAGFGIFLGLAAVVASAADDRLALIAIGIWAVVAGAGYLSVARIARLTGQPDGGLYVIAWTSIGVGIVTSTLPVFNLGSTPLVVGAALAATGVVTLVASQRLRHMPAEAPEVLSKREQRRRERAGGPGRG